MLRCAAFLVIAADEKVGFIPPNLRALPLELFTRSFKVIQLSTIFTNSLNIMASLKDNNAEETLDEILDGRLRIFQKKNGYRFSLDAILLANFISLPKNSQAID